MPTGFTEGILSGKITDFPQFAKLCIRNFGATIHMRDEPFDCEYKQREVSDYYVKQIDEAKKRLTKLSTISDIEIIKERKKEIKLNKKRFIEQIEIQNKNKEKLHEMLKSVTKWIPPTIEHLSFKSFMIEQIESTINFDCDSEYYNQKLSESEIELLSINAKEIRAKAIEKAKKDFEYATKSYNEELERCKNSNRWVSDLFNSL